MKVVKRLQLGWKTFAIDFVICLPYFIKFFLTVISTLSILSNICNIQIEKCEPMTKWNSDFDIFFQLQFFDRQERPDSCHHEATLDQELYLYHVLTPPQTPSSAFWSQIVFEEP